MTERKPPEIRFEDWVERQLRVARENGAFDDLPGMGKPIPGLDKPLTAYGWAQRWAEREGADLSAALPPALAMRKERETLRVELPTLASEAQVRELVADFNTRLRDAYLRPQTGPPIAVGPLDVEVALATWRAAHPPREPEHPQESEVARVPRRRWWHRARRR